MSCTQFLCHFCSQSSSKIARVPEVCDSSRSRLSKRKAGEAGCDVTKAALELGARTAVLDQRQVPSVSYPLLRDCEGRHVCRGS